MEKIVGKSFVFVWENMQQIVINFEKKKMLLLTKKELKLHQDETESYICGKIFLKKFANDKNYWKVVDHCQITGKYKGAAHNLCSLGLNVLNKIPAAFHKGVKLWLLFYHKRISKWVWVTFLMSWGKHRKVQKFFCSNRKRSYWNWWRW